MSNIFENAFFGKRYKTRDGHDAVYLFSYDCIIKTTHNLVVNAHYDDTHLCEIVTGDDGRVGSMESPFDIVSEWEEPITELELDKLAEENCIYCDICYDCGECTMCVDDSPREAYMEGFIAGCKEMLKRLWK